MWENNNNNNNEKNKDNNNNNNNNFNLSRVNEKVSVPTSVVFMTVTTLSGTSKRYL
jgi:hypothetical protein